jgi:isoquinoline 1-oxidoreductase subunit beta
MLVAAAAKKWGVPAAEITVANGKITHASGKSDGFGAFAELAAQETAPAKITLKNPDQFNLIGKSALRLDRVAKSNGSEIFASDLRVLGMKYAIIARSPLFGGTLTSFDATAAKAIKGVVDVVQVPTGVAVIADNTWAALQARDALKIVWDDTESEKRGTPALLADHRAMAAKPGSVSVKKTGAIAMGTSTLDAEFTFPYLAHATMEPMNALCEYKQGECHVTGGIQFHTVDHQIAAKTAGLGIDKVHLHTIYAGGSFGRRANPTADFIAESIEVVKATGKKYPILLQWTREDDMRGGYYRPMAVHKIAASLGSDGRIENWQQTVATQSIMKGTAMEAFIQNGVDPTAAEGNAGEQYDIPNVDISWAETKAGVSVLWWRSVGHTHNAYAKEVMMDMLAKASGTDPLQFRLAHLEKFPRHVAVLKLAAEKAGWGAKLPKGHARGIAVHESFGSVVAQVAEVSKGAGGVQVHKVVCAVDCGTAVNPRTVEAQMQSGIGYGLSAMLYGKITLKAGAVEQSNFDGYEVLRMEAMPEITVHILPSTNPPSGVGEPGTPPIAPAVANALFALTGKTVQSLPLNA